MDFSHSLAPLGFGFMRLPLLDPQDPKSIDIVRACELVDEFMASGFTYFDTARGYHGTKSEWALRKALVERYPRESFQVATKLPAWLARDADEARAMFDTSLAETGAGYFDYYLLHNLGEQLTAQFEEYDLWNFCLRKKEAGLVRNFGFSFHDNAQALDELLTRHPEVDFVQLQINYVDWESATIQSRRCYEVARAHGKPVVVMEPAKGGTLMRLPSAVAEVLHNEAPEASLASWAFRFAASLPGVVAVLSGMNEVAQVRENAALLIDGPVMTEAEYAVIGRVCEVLSQIPGVPCTDCRYCLKGCPAGVRIPTIMQSLNIYDQLGYAYRAQENYDWNTGRGKASKCEQCGACELVCPQHIPIMSELERAVELFE